MILAMAVTVYVPGGLPQWLRGRESLCNAGELQEMRFQSRDQEDPLEKEMVSHSSILTWKNPMDRGTWWAVVHGVTESQT